MRLLVYFFVFMTNKSIAITEGFSGFGVGAGFGGTTITGGLGFGVGSFFCAKTAIELTKIIADIKNIFFIINHQITQFASPF